MIGTIANTACIVVGSIVGGLAKQGLGKKYQDILFCAMGLAATGLGIKSVVEGMMDSAWPVLFIASLAIGGVIGTAIDIEGKFDSLVDRLSKLGSKKTQATNAASGTGVADAAGAADSVDAADAASTAAPAETAGTEAVASQDAPDASKNLARGLSTGIVLFCFGTLSILGPINSALYGDETFLFTNATLDLVTSMVLASSFGVGMAFAGAFLFCWQGAIFLLAQWLAPLMTADLMTEITIVGGFLIMASGFSILKIKEISVMNLLPALFVPPVWFALLPYLSL